MTRNPPSSPLNYPANNLDPTRIFRFDRAPTSNDFRNFKIRDIWNDVPAKRLYYLNEKSATSADWIPVGGGGDDTETLTGNTGAAVPPDGNNNINTIGTAPLTVAGDPGTNTLTWSHDGSLATTYDEDTGTATPAASILNVVGTAAQGISSTGAGNTITFTNADASETQKGVQENATDVEAVAITLTDKTIVPSNLGPVFASPPPIGSTLPNTGAFTQVVVDDLTLDDDTISSSGDINLKLGDAAGVNNLVIQDSASATIVNANSAGFVNFPQQPAVLAFVSANVANVTGDGTIYTIIMDSERYDINSDFNTGTGIFTAPVTGKYSFTWNSAAGNFTAAHTSMRNNLNTSNANYQGMSVNPFVAQDVSAASINRPGSVICDMDVSDTAFVTFSVRAGTKTVSVRGDAVNHGSRIAIQLVS